MEDRIKDMMDEPIMRLKEANCRNCYKCIRACPVKAIRMVGDRAEIVEDRCVYCGKCYMVCPQDARDLAGDLDKVRKMVRSGEKVCFSVSSTLTGFFPQANLRRLAVPLKKLGAVRIEDTSEGAGRMIQEYSEQMFEKKMKNAISSYCPSTNFLIQKYFPTLTQWMIPVGTPLEVHAKMMRSAYGEEIRVVGIGPCIAYQKLARLSEGGRLIDAYLTFEELESWLNEEGLQITEEEDEDTLFCSNYHWKYADEPYGVIEALPEQIKYQYRTWELNGETKAINMFQESGVDMDNYFMTVTACSNSCLGGPMFRLYHRDNFRSKDLWLKNIPSDVSLKKRNPSEDAEISIYKKYEPMPFPQNQPGEEDLEYFLSLIGREKAEDQLDCGACGYMSCREKAVAVYQGMADPFMCIPTSRDRAEAQSNLLFDNAPNGVIVMDREFRILEANAAAQNILGYDQEELKGTFASEYLNEEFMNHAQYKEADVIRETVECEKINKIISITFFKIKRHDISMAILYDRTDRARRIREVEKFQEETISVTQEVIEKQMRIAQEIASLLGETTAESKLAFNRLRNLLMIRGEKDE